MEPEIVFGSAEEQEVAAPADENETAAAEQGEDGAEAADRPPQGKKGNQDAAVASAAAAARRQAESRYRDALQAHIEQKQRIAESLGFDTFEDLESNVASQTPPNGMPPNAFEMLVQRAVEQNPVIREAAEQRDKAQIHNSFDEFARDFPDSGIDTMADFLKMPNFEEFYGYIDRGLTLSEAYMLVNRESITNRKAAAAKQAALNAVYGKAHMRSTAGGGEADEVVVPRDTYRSYRQMMPEWTDRQIREHYKQSTQKE